MNGYIIRCSNRIYSFFIHHIHFLLFFILIISLAIFIFSPNADAIKFRTSTTVDPDCPGGIGPPPIDTNNNNTSFNTKIPD